MSTLPPQVLKNRQKYQQPNRRPQITRSTTFSPSVGTSTEKQEETRNEDQWNAPSRTRSRGRRPGKKRTTTTSTTTTTTTTTTESVLDSSNELHSDENYPQIIQGPPTVPSENEQGIRHTLFDEELKSPDLGTLPLNEGSQRTSSQLEAFEQRENVSWIRNFVRESGQKKIGVRNNLIVRLYAKFWFFFFFEIVQERSPYLYFYHFCLKLFSLEFIFFNLKRAKVF